MRPAISSRKSSNRPAAPSRPEKAAPGGKNSVELAAYIAEMTAEMATLAGAADLPMLVYFLNLARVEADFHARGVDDRLPRA